MNLSRNIFVFFLCLSFASCKKEMITPIEHSCGSEFLSWKTDLQYGATNIDLEVVKMAQPLPNPVQLSPQGTVNNFAQERVILPSNGVEYDRQNQVFSAILSREEKMIRYDLSNGQSSIIDLDSRMTAPVINGGNYYTIKVLPNGYSQGQQGEFELLQIDPQTGQSIGAPSIAGDFPINSSFNHESMSSATDEQSQLFFLSSTNLLICNLNTQSFRAIDLYPNTTGSDYAVFLGLEYYAPNRLLAVRRTSEDYDLVEIDFATANVQIKQLINIDDQLPPNGTWDFNPEFYSSTLDACEEKYYLTTLEKTNPTVSTKLIEVDWNNNKVEVQSVPDYILGLQLIN